MTNFGRWINGSTRCNECNSLSVRLEKRMVVCEDCGHTSPAKPTGMFPLVHPDDYQKRQERGGKRDRRRGRRKS